MTIKELKGIQKSFNSMLEECDAKLKKVRAEIYEKYGYPHGVDRFAKDYDKDKDERFSKELDKAVDKIWKQYPFYTDFVEERAGANLAFKYMLFKAKEYETK